jgi:predicted nucleic acid-binding protein
LVVGELARAVTQKVPAASPRLEAFLTETPPEIVSDPAAGVAEQYLDRVNPGDAPIVAAGVSAEVDYFVTGDGRLRTEMAALGLTFRVLSPREFLEEVQYD